MIPELGHFALTLALAVALLQTVLPLVGLRTANAALMRFAAPAARVQGALVLLSYVCLSYAFAVDDFSVRYVANHSNSLLPMHYKLSAVWGAHEGSLLLWLLVLSLWTVAVTVFRRGLPGPVAAGVIGVMGFISAGFLSFTVSVSNPFERIFPAALEGRDLNPLLQDPGLVIHPPMLYMGYVGFAVAFAFAITALLDGRLDVRWARWSRPWTLSAWVFLTLGITLGSWWAYHELGWGGWWFWDPVENASFMPWLVGTALIHSLAVSEKRDTFKSWTILLAILAFSLSLLGTFLVRSGVLVSVHAFASDPARGVFILAFLGVVVGFSLALYAQRAARIESRGTFALVSRENFLLINNVLLLVSAATILIATLYPLFLDALGLDKISVGPPYFFAVFVPLALPLVFLAGVGPFLQWRRADATRISRVARYALPAALAVGVGAPLLAGKVLSPLTSVGIAVGAWTLFATAWGLLRHARVQRPPASLWGMTCAHVGLGIFVIGVAFNETYSMEREVRVDNGDSVELAGYEFLFKGVGRVQGVNYTAERGRIEVSRQGRAVATLFPQKRTYTVQTNPMTEAAIHATALRDLYVALGEPAGGKRGLRIYYRPLIRWIWLGALLIALGGAIAAADRRYRAHAAPGALKTAAAGVGR